MRHEFERYCKDYQSIENYDRAATDNFKGWHCHHRLETHNSDGIRRDVDISHKELKALGMYYNRPANELIFLTTREHNAFNKGKHPTEETRNKLREANKGRQPMLGKHHSEETRKKMSEAHKDKMKGKHWYNNGKINVRVKECPKGFVPGRLR